MIYDESNDIKILKKLVVPDKKIHIVLDTDTYNEVDDQFALPYALLSPERLVVEAVYAAPFLNERAESPMDGMEKSYDEIVRLMGKMGKKTENVVFKGSTSFLKDEKTPVDSPAARDLVTRAMNYSEKDPLYVVAIGAITNVASAILMNPDIIERIVVVWLGGNAFDWPADSEYDPYQFNLTEDIPAAKVVFNSTIPMVYVPALNASSHLLTTLAELKEHIGGKNELCDALIELFSTYTDDHFAWGKEIWDVATVAYLINPEWVVAETMHRPILCDNARWAPNPHGSMIKNIRYVKRNPIFADMFKKLAACKIN